MDTNYIMRKMRHCRVVFIIKEKSNQWEKEGNKTINNFIIHISIQNIQIHSMTNLIDIESKSY